MKVKKTLILAACILITAIVFSEIYKKTIVSMYGQQIPEQWASGSGFEGMTFGEIYQKIGLPQEDLSEKEYQNWLLHYWWGWKMLKIIGHDCCPLSSKPTSIYYIVYVNCWYKPAYLKKIR